MLVLFVVRGALAQGNAPVDIYSGDSALRRQPAATAFPEYPEEARRERLQGEATVCFKVNLQGEIVRPRIASSTHRVFEKPAMRAIRESAFAPLDADEVESASDVCRVYRFRLNPLPALVAAAPQETAPPTAAAEVAPPTEPTPFAAPAVSVAAASPLIGSEQPAPMPATADSNATTEVIVITGKEDEPICEMRKRPGSMIVDRICFSPLEMAKLEEIKLRTIKELDREFTWIDKVLQDARMHNEYPRGIDPQHP
jgi:TonB family protein